MFVFQVSQVNETAVIFKQINHFSLDLVSCIKIEPNAREINTTTP